MKMSTNLAQIWQRTIFGRRREGAGPAAGSNTLQLHPPCQSVENQDSKQTTDRSDKRPGAYRKMAIACSGPAQAFRVIVPAGAQARGSFIIRAGLRRVRVQCPTTVGPGNLLHITVPPEPVFEYVRLRSAPLSPPELGGSVRSLFVVTIPPNTTPGMQFTVIAGGQWLRVTCPQSAGPNMRVRIIPPERREEPEVVPTTQLFEVVVPEGVLPGERFRLIANGQEVFVVRPPTVDVGQRFQFRLPYTFVPGDFQLGYISVRGRWKRTVRESDLKFQWVRLDDGVCKNLVNDGSGTTEHFDFMKLAYVRKLNFLEGQDVRMRTGTVKWVSADKAVAKSSLVVNNLTLLTYRDVAVALGKPLQERQTWFLNICDQLTTALGLMDIRICVRRNHLLTDSMKAIMALGRDDMRKRWRIEFLGERSVEQDAVTKEWFELVTGQMYDPEGGLWIPSAENQDRLDINPASAVSYPDDHLIRFRFLGRVIGRALFEGQIVKAHMTRMIYKYLLGWPITFEDVKEQDGEYYQVLIELCRMGLSSIADHIWVGALDRSMPQLTEFLFGFFDVVPEAALTVFDANELELLFCGPPTINLECWKANTNYYGEFETKGETHQNVKWFWEIITEEFDHDMRTSLVQFATGTSDIPEFVHLQGIHHMKKFSLQGVDPKMYPYPQAHSDFKRINLPCYASKNELCERLKFAITQTLTSLWLE